MDGVLVDSEPLHEKAQQLVYQQFGLGIPQSLSSTFKGWSEERVFGYIADHFGTGSATIEDLIHAKHKAFANLSDELELIPGAMDLLHMLHQEAVPMGLVTSATKSDQERTFTKFGLTHFFSSVITVEDVHKPKPDPQPYLSAASNLNLPPTNCVVVEDSKYGVISATHAGCHVVGLTTTFPYHILNDAGAHAIFNSMSEIHAYLTTVLAPLTHSNSHP